MTLVRPPGSRDKTRASTAAGEQATEAEPDATLVGDADVTDEVERARRGELWGSLKRQNDSRERRTVYQTDHVTLVDALCARELALATETMETHLARVEANLLGAVARSAKA